MSGRIFRKREEGNLDFIDFPALFKYLSKVSRQPYKSIIQMSFSNFNKQLNLLTEKSYDFDAKNEFKILWKTRGIYNYEVGLKYCPVCLRQDNIPHFRKRWRLRYISICFEHNCYLIERCPVCNRLIENYTVRWGAFNIKHCSKCSADLSQAEPKLISLDDPLLTISKKYLIDNLFNAEKIYSLLYKAWNEVSLEKLSDEIYRNHPLTLDKELISLWKNKIPPCYYPNRNLLFSNIRAVFLIIGTTIKNIIRSN